MHHPWYLKSEGVNIFVTSDHTPPTLGIIKVNIINLHRYVHIQIEDKHDYRTALAYINQLPSLEKKKENVKTFGKQVIYDLLSIVTAVTLATRSNNILDDVTSIS